MSSLPLSNPGRFTDPIDAIAAARTVLSGDGVSQAKDTTGPAEQLRLLLAARTRLVSAATAITNSIHSLLTTAPEPLRERYRRLDTPALITRLARTRPTRTITTPQQAATSALHHMARTHQNLHHWTARCFSDTACLGFQAALVRPRNSCSTSLGVRYPRAE